MIINASPLIIFGKLNKVDILRRLYNKIQITQSVYEEVVLKGTEKNLRDALIIKEHINNKEIEIYTLNEKFSSLANKIQEIYKIQIGEAETIALALQLKEKKTIIDETSAREAAKAFGLNPIGSLKVLLSAYKKGFLREDDIHSMINEMENSKYRFSPQVLMEFWNLFKNIK